MTRVIPSPKACPAWPSCPHRCHSLHHRHDFVPRLADKAEKRTSIICASSPFQGRQRVEPHPSSILRLRRASPRPRAVFRPNAALQSLSEKRRPLYCPLWAAKCASAAIIAAFVGLHRAARDRVIWLFFLRRLGSWKPTRQGVHIVTRVTIFGEGKV